MGDAGGSDSPHSSVLLEEAVDAWLTDPDGIYVDGTFGRGGHSERLLSKLSPAAQLLVVDRDPEAIAEAQAMALRWPQMQVEHAEFACLASLVEGRDWTGKVSGILLDLGVSSPQLDNAGRGFSFLRDGALDMRMDPGAGTSAADWLEHAPVEDIVSVIKTYGEEKFARRIATAIDEARKVKKITTTAQLAALVEDAIPVKEKGKHPATRTFQAIRMFINQELQQVEQFLESCVEMLRPQGRLVVISFHSLEDRLVKRFMRRQARGDDYPASLPVTEVALHKKMRLVGKAVRPGETEIENNPRARSAILRVAEKL